jgi:DnaJ-class molecular chaperone
LILKNQGCYLGINKKERGDLYIWWKIKLPKKLAPINVELLRSIQQKTSWNPNRDFIEKNEHK